MMKKLNFYDNRVMNRFFKVQAAILMLVMFAGCAGGNYGKMVWDRELDNTFASYQVLPNHRYYITGGYGAPAAILAIAVDYQLVNAANLWVPVPDVSPARMREWVDSLSNEIKFWDGQQFMAAYILDPQGKRVGAWYSGQRDTRMEFFEDNRIKVYPPNLKPGFHGDSRGENIKP